MPMTIGIGIGASFGSGRGSATPVVTSGTPIGLLLILTKAS